MNKFSCVYIITALVLVLYLSILHRVVNGWWLDLSLLHVKLRIHQVWTPHWSWRAGL